MNKRILSLVLVLTLVLGSFSFAFADTGLTAAQKIEELKRLGFVKGNETGDLMLDKNIDRASTAVIVAKALEAGDGKTEEQIEASIKKSDYQGKFPDVKTSHWANAYINNAVERGIVKGTDKGTFLPDQDITYAEVITMMVQILGKEVDKNVSWPENYIGAARKAGILEGITSNYKAKADREGVFVLLYNTITGNKVGNFQIDKVLVLENNRLESIGKNELVVEVIKEVQRANFVDSSRANKNNEDIRGEQYRVTVPSEVADVEDLLGKVIDLSYDKAYNAVKTTVDNSYTYVQGSITKADDKKVVVGREPNEKSYTVSIDERYRNSDDRLFRTYVNDKDTTYERFYKDVKTADFARLTVKNGKVLFIDAYNFEDIAPVKEVKKDGSEVYVYNDSRDGDVKRIDFKEDRTKAVAVKDGKFSRIELKDIDALDVVHVYGDNKVLVKQDAEVKDTYKKVSEDKYSHYVTVGDKDYTILDKNTQRAVYSYDSKKFYTLEPKQADRVLREFKDEKVTLLLDVNNDVQYFGSEIEAGEFVAGIDSIVGKDLRLVKSDSKTDLTANLDTKVKLDGSTSHQNLNLLNKKDIVYVAAKDKDLNKVYRLVSATKATTDAKAVAKDESKYDFNENYIKIAPNTDYKVLDRTNVFYYDGDKVVATTIKHVKDNQDADKTLKAYVVTDKAYDSIVEDAKRPTTGRDDVANTIVFTEVSFKNETTKEIVHITAVNATGDKYEIEYKDVNGSKTTKEVEKGSDAHDYIRTRGLSEARKALVEAIAELSINKDDAKEISKIDVKISKDHAVYKVVSSTSNSGYRLVTFADRSGEERTFWTNTSVKEFGNVGTSGSKVSFSFDTKGEINAIIVRSSDATLSAWDGSAVKTNVLDKVLEVEGKVILQIDGKLYQYAGKASDVKSFETKEVTFKTQTLNGVEYAFDVKLKEAAPQDPQDPQDPQEITAEAEFVLNPIVQKYVLRAKLSDSSKTIEKFIVGDTTYDVHSQNNGYTVSQGTFDTNNLVVKVVVGGEEITATIK